MKLPKQARLYTAVATAALGLAAVSTSMVAQAQTAPNVSRSNTGQALIFPYYTVNNGWATTFNVMNTSNKTLAVKVRFHESKNSRDVLDFNIVMSPYDAWTGWVQNSPEGPQLFTEDTSCTSPLNVNGVTASLIATTGQFSDTGGDGYNRMREGYVEVLIMGEAETIEAPPTDFNPAAAFDSNESLYVPYYAKHDADGVPRDCSIVDRAFINKSDQWPGGNVLPTAVAAPAPIGCFETVTDPSEGSGYPLARCDFVAPTGNWLKGNVSWLNAAVGAGAGSEAIAVETWSTSNFVTAQTFPWFLEPTFASSEGLWTITGVTGFEAAVSAAATMNEWASNPTNGAATDWVVTFPTKAFHVDAFNDQIQAASNKYRNNLADVVDCADGNGTSVAAREECTPLNVPLPVAPFEYLFGVQGNGNSTITVSYDLYDREEGTTTIQTDGTTISPAPPPEITIDTLQYEANVIQFAETPVLFSSSPAVVDVPNLLGAPNGWAQLNFDEALPVTAFAVKVVNQGIPSQAIGQAMDAGYIPAPPPAE